MSRGRHHTPCFRGTDPSSAQHVARTPLMGLSKFAPPSTSRSSVHSRGPRCTHLRSHRPGVATTRLVPSLPFLPTSTVFSARAPQACCIPQPIMGFTVFQRDLALSGIWLLPSWVRRPADPGVGAPKRLQAIPPGGGITTALAGVGSTATASSAIWSRDPTASSAALARRLSATSLAPPHSVHTLRRFSLMCSLAPHVASEEAPPGSLPSRRCPVVFPRCSAPRRVRPPRFPSPEPDLKALLHT